MHGRSLTALVCVAALCAAYAHSATADSAPPAPSACNGLAAVDFSSVSDAPTRITSARPVEATAGHPAFCEINGYVTPSVGFQLMLPSSQWNGKLMQLGCGGYCGSIDPGSTIPFDCDDMLRRGYACIISDNGHRSTSGDALWAYNNSQAEIDHAYRGVHVTALAGKAIVERHYGRAPRKAYFMGSSTGGRLAFMAAQRFPWDFDGIVAGVPSLSVTGIHMNLLWGNRVFTNEAGEHRLTAADLGLLHRAVLAKCDMNDGIKDGVIGDPRVCGFDPRELTCRDGRRTGCLTASQVDVASEIYRGASTSRGESVYMPGALRGSEKTWSDWFGKLYTEDPRLVYNFVREEFRYSAFHPDPGPSWQPELFDFDRDYKRLGTTDALSAAVNPDLRRFHAAGGKLIAFAGWSDAGGMPLHTVDYYETAERVSGGSAATQDFFRLFLIPGMGHAFGDGTFAVDWLSYLEAWVEQGRPPDEVLSVHVRIDDLDMKNPQHRMDLFRRMEFPLDPDLIEFSRPVYPYPVSARYRGSGDPRDAASFERAPPNDADAHLTRSSLD